MIVSTNILLLKDSVLWDLKFMCCLDIFGHHRAPGAWLNSSVLTGYTPPPSKKKGPSSSTSCTPPGPQPDGFPSLPASSHEHSHLPAGARGSPPCYPQACFPWPLLVTQLPNVTPVWLGCPFPQAVYVTSDLSAFRSHAFGHPESPWAGLPPSPSGDMGAHEIP